MRETKPQRQTAVWVLPLDSSGCGACTQQIYALLAPRYAAELRAHGVSLARSPRHADVVLVTGALSQAAREAVSRVLEAVPQPRALVAVGNCAINGCVFRGSPHLVDGAAEVLDVNVEIAGCPPSPRAILDAIAEAAQLLASETEVSDEEAEDATGGTTAEAEDVAEAGEAVDADAAEDKNEAESGGSDT
jgi:Ni,Fe-hydrogenase III small subunit